MPEALEPVRVPDVNPEAEPFVFSPEQLKDALALKIVTQTFAQYESFRTANHDRRWIECDALYSGYIPAKVWEGTTIPRANLPYQICFDQLESAYPSIMQSLFGDEEWFEVVAEPGTSAKDALKVKRAMQYMLEHGRNDFGLTARAEFGMAIRDVLKYGNGGVWMDWDRDRKRPMLSWVDIRDVYIDPAASTSNTDESRAIIRRRMMTVQEIADFREDIRMKVPEDGVLWSMAQNAPVVSADSTKQSQEALRSVAFYPQQADYLPNPADRKIEVLIYYSKSQIVWVLNRVHVLFNEANPYHFIPCSFAPCYQINGRFYAAGIPEVQRGNQRMIEGLLNGHLDETSLALHPPRTQARASAATNSQRKWGPGFVFQVDSKDDINILQPSPVTGNVMQDVGFLLEAADKRTGIGSVAQGMPRPGNANRTATGMNIQAQGAANRIQPIVQNIEDYLIVPILRKMYKMLAFHLSLYDKVPMKRLVNSPEVPQNGQNPAQAAPQAPGMPPQVPQLPPGAPNAPMPPQPPQNALLNFGAAEPHEDTEGKEEKASEGEIEWAEGWIFQRPCDFSMFASSKMLSKSNLMQIFPFITQYLLSGPLIEALKANGQSIDFSELLRMLQDAAGTEGRYDLIRPMTPQEQQKAQQPPPQVVQQQQLESMKHQNSKEIMGMKIQGELQKTMMTKQKDPQEAQMAAMESQQAMQTEAQKMQWEREKAQMQMLLQQQKVESDRQLAELKLQLQKRQGEIALQTQQQKSFTEQQAAQQKMQLDGQRAAMDLQNALFGNQQSLRHAEENHQMGLRQNEQIGQQKIKMAGQRSAAKGSAKSSESTSSEPRKRAEVRKKAR